MQSWCGGNKDQRKNALFIEKATSLIRSRLYYYKKYQLQGIEQRQAKIKFVELIHKKIEMHLLSFILEKAAENQPASSAFNLLMNIFPALAITGLTVLSKKQKQKLKWQFLKSGLKKLFRSKKDKGGGAVFFLLFLLLIAGAAVLWVLWELGGIFALILGIVGGLALLSLILKTK